jgi:hypothetical protein
MDLLGKDELRVLMQIQEGWCISIFMPTHRVSPETKQDPIRFKNLLRQAQEQLTRGGLRPTETRKLLKSAKALIKDGLFWQYQSDGLAAFLSSRGFLYYRLPIKFDVVLIVTDRFHIKPLLPLFTNNGRFFILALSQNQVKLFHCTRYSQNEVEVEGIPRSLSEALRYDEPERQLQFHTRTPTATGERAAMFHGQGVGIDDTKNNILRFFQQVDQGLHPLLREEKAPLILAGVEYLLPIYREANRYPHLLNDGITGNPEGLRPDELREHGWKIVGPHFLKGQEEGIAQYRLLSGSGQASNSIEEIVRAAYDGRIGTLFVTLGIQQWGFFDLESKTAHLHPEAEPGDEDLLDFAAVHTFLNDGKVYALKQEEMPDGASIAAVFRY